MHFINQSEKNEIVKFCFGLHYLKQECYHAISKKEERQNSKVLQRDLVKKVFLRYPESSLVKGQFEAFQQLNNKNREFENLARVRNRKFARDHCI